MTPSLAKIAERESKRIRPLIGCFILLPTCGVLCAAEPVRDQKLRISFVVPDGFVTVPENIREPEFPHQFIRGLDDPEKTILIRIKGVSGKRVTGNVLSDEDMEVLRTKQPGAERFSVEWKSIRVDGVRTFASDERGVRWVQDVLPLSTLPESTLILVSGPESRAAEVRDVLREVLRNFEGTPSLRAAAEGNRRAGGSELKNYHLVLAAAGLLALISFGRWRTRRKRMSPPATPI